MRKAIIFGLLMAGAAVPAPVLAQDNVAQTREERRQARQEARQQMTPEERQARRERRAARQQQQPTPEQRQERREARQEAAPQQREQREQRRAERGQQAEPAITGWIGDPNDPRMEAHRRRYERLERRNAREHGTEEQFRSVVQQQRGERIERRRERREVRRDHRRHGNEHRDLHRDYRADHRDLHQGDPSRREHRQWHRETNRDHRQTHRQWNRDWRRDQRYDWRSFRNRNRYIFRAPTYYAPYRGYGYSRFGAGSILDRLFWGRNYWINDPFQYRLPPAPVGYVWVRYYNDVVLVDTWSGRIVDVIHDFFW